MSDDKELTNEQAAKEMWEAILWRTKHKDLTPAERRALMIEEGDAKEEDFARRDARMAWYKKTKNNPS